MTKDDVIVQYFDAWNRQELSGILAIFAQRGVYCDPGTSGPLSGAAIMHYWERFFIAFPDASLELTDLLSTGTGKFAAQWRLRGTNTGLLYAHEPTGCTIDLPGAYFFTLEGEKLRSLQGYFDQRDFLHQAGLQVVVQPLTAGPLHFGTTVHMRMDSDAKPEAFSVTWFDTCSEESTQKVNEHSWLILKQLSQDPGFIGYISIHVGTRQYTIAAWKDVESAKSITKNAFHAKAVRDFFHTDLGSAGHTSIWTTHCSNPLWIRCVACGLINNYEKKQETCRCGAVLPPIPAYW